MTYEPIPGKPHNPSEEETMSVIRSVLTELEEPAPSRKARRAERKAQAFGQVNPPTPAPSSDEEQPRAFVERTMAKTERRRASDLPELNDAPVEDAPKPRKAQTPKTVGMIGSHLRAVAAKVRAFRPTTRHIALLSMALLVVLRPHWFVITGVLVVALFVGTFLILGSDRIWRAVIGWLNHVEVRNPDRATRLRDRLDRFACRWDAILDVFPDGMVDGLYMPDLQAMQDADEAHTQAMAARLNRMAHDT